MKKILGLDLGVGSCGWALILVDDDYCPINILGIGSRVIPLSADDSNDFSRGNAISKNANRTAKRTQRKGYDRYQLRRFTLRRMLEKLGMLPDESLVGLDILSLWTLRANSAKQGCKVSLKELGRILLHLNQKRGYKHSKLDVSADSKQTEYVRNVNERKSNIDSLGLTIGQYFASQIKESEVVHDNGKRFYTYRTKDQVFPRSAYEAEYDQIMKCQQEFYPELLTDEVIAEIRNIIYFQRPLKSCKHLVALCDFEKRAYINKDGKTVFDGPKVAPCSSPLFQICRIYEAINNISIYNLRLKNKASERDLFDDHICGNRYELDAYQRQEIFDYLYKNDKITGKYILEKILKLKSSDGWRFDKLVDKGIKGNTTYTKLANALKPLPNKDELLRFDLKVVDTKIVDTDSGEIIQEVSADIINQPLYQLWHAVYSIKERRDLERTLRRNFGITDSEVIDSLYNIDFVTDGFGNRSNKFMRKLIPYLREGMKYSDASTHVGVNHSNSLTKEENEQRQLLSVLPNLPKNSLRQPIVEKILNQMINIVNAVKTKYGDIDEIRIEMARELKQSKDERNQMSLNISKRERENKTFEERIESYGLKATRSRVQKIRMHEESGCKCMYCGQPVGIKEFLIGYNSEVEHVIPRSLFFDDSFSNKVCSCRACNQAKGNMTAYDFMQSKGDEEFEKYQNRVNELYEAKKISKTKRDRLLTSRQNIPTDFLNRDLRETQYISKKAKEILLQICYHVNTTTGSVTDFFRHAWGYDEILATLNLPRYKQAGLTELQEFEHAGQKHVEEKIVGWSKRMDHRHHAIDALTIALTRQGYIQRLNNLNTERDAMFAELNAQSEDFKMKHTLLQEWAKMCPHFDVGSVLSAVGDIAVSFKAGKKVSTPAKRIKYVKGKRVVLQDGLLTPRGAMSEETVYGKIKQIDKDKPLKYLFEHPDLIVNPKVRHEVVVRLQQHDGEIKKAIESVKKNPLYRDSAKKIELKSANCFKNELVVKYKIDSLKLTDIDYIVDHGIRERVRRRFEECGNKNGDYQKSFKDNPLYFDDDKHIPINSVRCFTGLAEDRVKVVKKDSHGRNIGYAKPGNNHHVALYSTPEGKMEEKIVSFWEAVERKNLGLPVIVDNPTEIWDNLTSSDKEYPTDILDNLPEHDWKFIVSMQQNEMFILGMSDDEYNDAIEAKDKKALCEHLYRVQKLSFGKYMFRRHVETNVEANSESRNAKKYYEIQSFKALFTLNPRKVSITSLGEILDYYTKESII